MSMIFLALLFVAAFWWFDKRLEDRFMATQEQLAASLRALNEQLVKARGELVTKIEALEEAIANQGSETTPEVDAALEALKAQVQGLDDLNPDAPSEEPTPGEGEPTV